MIQLEYWLDGDWREVVRYDHDRDAPVGHDITVEGLHRDLYRDGGKYRVDQVSGPLPANDGFNVAEEDLRENVENYIKRYEKIRERIGEHFDHVRDLLEKELDDDV